MTQGPDVTPAEALRAAAAGEVLLVDVREDHEWEAGHAPYAVHVPLGSLQADTLPRDRPVLALCRVGGRSASAAEALGAIGYDVRNTAGGMLAWQAAGLPVVVDGGGPGTVDETLADPVRGRVAAPVASAPTRDAWTMRTSWT